ncbi:uncharacterized protein LOC143723103 [Siphateles boraxobius]|uniref:uncharacterized protein LOC143723103 n=1 Tax=Siphateles boraxobius TaxID=180520 RepID=UPI0040636051
MPEHRPRGRLHQRRPHRSSTLSEVTLTPLVLNSLNRCCFCIHPYHQPSSFTTRPSFPLLFSSLPSIFPSTLLKPSLHLSIFPSTLLFHLFPPPFTTSPPPFLHLPLNVIHLLAELKFLNGCRCLFTVRVGQEEFLEGGEEQRIAAGEGTTDTTETV